jgi:hypothetical protein
MRHFLLSELAQPLPVSRLPDRLKTAGASLDAVRRPGAAERIAPLLGPAVGAETLTAIASAAETQLNPTPPAEREAILLRRQETPCRRFLDMELRLW